MLCMFYCMQHHYTFTNVIMQKVQPITSIKLQAVTVLVTMTTSKENYHGN